MALYGFLLFPDTPRTTKAPYFNPTERSLAIARVPEIQEKRSLDFKFLRHVLVSWQWWGVLLLWIIAGETESFGSSSLISLWLMAKGRFSVAQLNNYPTGVPAVGIVSTFFRLLLRIYLVERDILLDTI